MKIMIIGVGRLGSQVAFLTLMRVKPEKLILSDVVDLKGEILDLQHACRGLEIKTEITTKKEPCDLIVISAGFARSVNLKTHDELFDLNAPIVKQVVKELDGCLKEGTKVIVMTNPVERMTDIVRELMPDCFVTNPESILMEMRGNKELGWEIVSSKGFSSFGPAVSSVILMERLMEE